MNGSSIEFDTVEDQDMGLGSFPDHTVFIGYDISDEGLQAAREFGWRCAEEVCGTSRELLRDMADPADRAKAIATRNVAFQHAIENPVIIVKILAEVDDDLPSGQVGV